MDMKDKIMKRLVGDVANSIDSAIVISTTNDPSRFRRWLQWRKLITNNPKRIAEEIGKCNAYDLDHPEVTIPSKRKYTVSKPFGSRGASK